jgi:hypothetical protein
MNTNVYVGALMNYAFIIAIVMNRMSVVFIYINFNNDHFNLVTFQTNTH